MEITYLGHSCFQVAVAGVRLLFDPFISPNELASHIDISALKPDYILITHGHEDHVADVEMIAKQSGAKLISNYEIISYYEKKGLKGHPLNHGGQWAFDFGKVRYVNAVHTSSMPDGSYGGQPGGFVVMTSEGNFYVAGDTALTYDMKLIPETICSLDVAILPIGDNFTMGYQDAITAAKFIECSHIIPAHYDTFGYIKVDKKLIEREFNHAKIKLTFMEIGGMMVI
ncbi:UNVERIFIED_CONTAM: hypothetical protein GTU68_062849 [Idotea baltica]|nr:hypothetical protein [Idotea baltica]